MHMSFRLSLGILVSAALIAGCGGGGARSALPPGSSSPAASGAAKPASQLEAQSWGHQAGRPHHITFLALTIEGSGNAVFSVNRDDDEDGFFTSKSPVTAPIPAFTLTCPSSKHGDRRHRSDEDNRRCHLTGDGDTDDISANYYVREIELTRDHHDDDDDVKATVVAGPGTASAKNTITFPAANSPLAIAAGTRYRFELVRTTSSLATPTPPPVTDPCPQLSNVGPLSPPKAISVTDGDPSVVQNLPQSATGTLSNLSCAIGGKMYYTAKLFINGNTYQFDPLAGTTTQWSAVAADMVAVGGDQHVYEQGAFGKNKASQIAQFSLDGTTQTYVAGGLPNFLVAGPDGMLYTAINSGGVGIVQQIKADATVAQFNMPGSCGGSLDADASGPAGKLWFHSAACGVLSMTTSGAFATVAPLPDYVSAMAGGPDGALYAVDTNTNSIDRIDPATGTVTSWNLPANLQAAGLGRGTGSTMWFDAYDTNSGTEKLAVINLLSGKITQFDQGSATLSGHYTIGPDGNVYTTSSNPNAILRMSGTMNF